MNFKIESHPDEMVIRFALDEIDPQTVRKRIHDLKAALRTINFCITNLEDGYRFDDEMAEAKLTALNKASKAIKSEFQLVETIYQELLQQKPVIDP